jgi:hypothetical protein
MLHNFKKAIILVNLFAVFGAFGMYEQPYSDRHARMCSAPGGLWALENPCLVHKRTFSAPVELSSVEKSDSQVLKKVETNSRLQKQKYSNKRKKHSRPSRQSAEVRKQQSAAAPVTVMPHKSNQQIISVKQNVINARNQQQKTNQTVRKVLKKKSFEKVFISLFGQAAGKFIADKLFDVFHFFRL